MLTAQLITDDTATLKSSIWHAGVEDVAPSSTGWLEDIEDSVAGVALHANTGTRSSAASDIQLFAGIVGYTTGTVVWSITSWAPLSGSVSPILVQDNARADVVKVRIENDVGADARNGVLTITASVDGTPAADSIILTIGSDSFYPSLAWGPAV